MQGYLAYGFIAFAGSITKRASLYSIFINSRIGSLTNHSIYKHMYYFQAGGKQSEFCFPSSIFHLSVLTTMLNRRQAVPDCLAIRESKAPSWVPRKHTPRLYPGHKQD